MCVKMFSAKWRPFSLSPNVLLTRIVLHPSITVQNSPTPWHAVLWQELINGVCQLNGKVLARVTGRIDGRGKADGNMKSFSCDLQRHTVIMQIAANILVSKATNSFPKLFVYL